MSQAWCSWYWGDYLKDTADLTLAEHGAYILLLGHYYSTGESLPANAEQLKRICRCTCKADAVAMHTVLDRFFTNGGGRYTHKRVNEELKRQREISEKRRHAANLRHHAKA